mmetsp:Transcript_32969/g.106609  ORF Transcript_32969/g.106609 Transcript_32969/m.106609 type:complete len:204 (+) Transcript_32969:1105-1716(+)|eukprot:scaffold6716_cov114-Isochrysis_galbana.AAC.1
MSEAETRRSMQATKAATPSSLRCRERTRKTREKERKFRSSLRRVKIRRVRIKLPPRRVSSSSKVKSYMKGSIEKKSMMASGDLHQAKRVCRCCADGQRSTQHHIRRQYSTMKTVHDKSSNHQYPVRKLVPGPVAICGSVSTMTRTTLAKMSKMMKARRRCAAELLPFTSTKKNLRHVKSFDRSASVSIFEICTSAIRPVRRLL